MYKSGVLIVKISLCKEAAMLMPSQINKCLVLNSIVYHCNSSNGYIVEVCIMPNATPLNKYQESDQYNIAQVETDIAQHLANIKEMATCGLVNHNVKPQNFVVVQSSAEWKIKNNLTWVESGEVGARSCERCSW